MVFFERVPFATMGSLYEFLVNSVSLYRKYRPQNFASLVGQEHVSSTLHSALKSGRTAHAYLFTGPRGTGKTSSARILAKAMNCLDLQDGEPCEKCEICSDINEGRLIDVIEIDAASNRGIDEMRDLREKIHFAPTRAKYKVYIIDEVHMLTKEAFNALLKTLEEPPAHVYFILATTEVHKIPETILSRCQRFDFRRIADKAMIDRLQFIADSEQIKAETKALAAISHHADGGLRDAIGLLEKLSVDGEITLEHASQVLGLSGFASLEKLYQLLGASDAKNALDEIQQLYVQGFDLQQFTKSFLEYMRKQLVANVESGNNAQISQVVRWLDIFREAYDQARYSPLPSLALEIAVVKACGLVSAPVAVAPVSAAPSAARVAPVSAVAPAPSAPVSKPNVGGSTAVANDIPKAALPITAAVAESMAERTHQGLDVSFDMVKSKWARILEHMKSPTAKRAFQGARLHEVSGGVVTLGFATNFNMEKMMELALRLELEGALAAVIGQPLSVKGIVLKGVSMSVPTPIAAAEPERDELADTVAAMFDGQVI